jgi:hypothetical protein
MGFGLEIGFHEMGPNQKIVGKSFYILFHGFDLADQVTGIFFR